MENTEQEVWKSYPDYNFIEVNQFGEIRTKDRVVPCNGGKRLVKGRILKQLLRPDGYIEVNFSVNNKQVKLLVHRATATCFIPNPNNYPEVNHKDNDRTNNSVSNLEWCSREYNEAYKKNFGTSQTEISGLPVIAINPDTSEVFWFESQSEAARQLDVSRGNIYSIIKGKLNKTKGYWFCRADESAVENVKIKFGDEVANKVEKLMNEHCN